MVLAAAQRAFDALDYREVPGLAREVLSRDDVQPAMRIRALLLLGSALVILGDLTDADEPFRDIVRSDPQFDLPSQTEPKIVAAFRRVQVSELARLAAEREAERQRRIAAMQISGIRPTSASGGKPLSFAYTILDPSATLAAASVAYRRETQSAYSTLPLELGADGVWRGTIAGEWTASPSPYRIEWFLETVGNDGLALGGIASATNPERIIMAPGDVPRPKAFYETWWFWTLAGVGATAAGTTGYILYRNGRSLPATDLGAVPAR